MASSRLKNTKRASGIDYCYVLLISFEKRKCKKILEVSHLRNKAGLTYSLTSLTPALIMRATFLAQTQSMHKKGPQFDLQNICDRTNHIPDKFLQMLEHSEVALSGAPFTFDWNPLIKVAEFVHLHKIRSVPGY